MNTLYSAGKTALKKRLDWVTTLIPLGVVISFVAYSFFSRKLPPRWSLPYAFFWVISWAVII